MSFNKLNAFTKDVSDFADQVSGDPAVIKAQFDAAPEELREYFNNLIDALKSTANSDSGAKNIGVTAINGLTGTDVQTILESINSSKANITQETSQSVALATGSADGGRGIQIFKDTLGLLHVNIDIQFSGNISTNTILGTLPSGYRPAVKVTDTCAGYASGLSTISLAEININTDGTIVLGANAGIMYLHKMFPPFKAQ